MKKIRIFILVFILVLSSGSLYRVNAESFYLQDYDCNISCSYDVTYANGLYTYVFTFSISNAPYSTGSMIYFGESYTVGISSDAEYVTDTRLAKYTYEKDDSDRTVLTTGVLTFTSDKLYYDSSGINNLVLKCGVQLGDSAAWQYYYVKFTSDNPVPDNVPVVSPEPTPTNTPTPKPTVTPEPTPTNTPTSTPGISPDMSLDVSLEGNVATAEYYTGGYAAVSSYIEFYEINGNETLLVREQVPSGHGIRSDILQVGKVYCYKLIYIFDNEGMRYSRELWSENISIVDSELDDYQQNGSIRNFRTLMLCVWDRFFDLQISVEGHRISFRVLFIWTLIVTVLIWIFKKFFVDD